MNLDHSDDELVEAEAAALMCPGPGSFPGAASFSGPDPEGDAVSQDASGVDEGVV
jgi:hypothetical protein